MRASLWEKIAISFELDKELPALTTLESGLRLLILTSSRESSDKLPELNLSYAAEDRD